MTLTDIVVRVLEGWLIGCAVCLVSIVLVTLMRIIADTFRKEGSE